MITKSVMECFIIHTEILHIFSICFFKSFPISSLHCKCVTLPTSWRYESHKEMIGRLQNLAQRFPDIAKVMKWFHVTSGLQAKKKLLHVDYRPRKLWIVDMSFVIIKLPLFQRLSTCWSTYIIHISYLRSVPLETQCKEDHSSISNSAAMFKRWFIIFVIGISMVQSLTYYWTFKTFCCPREETSLSPFL